MDGRPVSSDALRYQTLLVLRANDYFTNFNINSRDKIERREKDIKCPALQSCSDRFEKTVREQGSCLGSTDKL
eukprot:scaffold21820_cov51-Attheya_sp.AAC.1